MHSSSITVSCQYHAQQSLLHQIALVVVTLLCFTVMGHANQERILTSKHGHSTHFRLVERSGDSIIAVRTTDSQRFVIPLSSLSESDQKFLATWTPPAKGYQPSSVSLAGRSSLTRGAYPSRYQPRHSSGRGYTRSYSGGGGGGGCRYIGSRTVTINPCR